MHEVLLSFQRTLTGLVSALLLGMAAPALAQPPAAAEEAIHPGETGASSIDPETADIAITATVRIREMSFEADPEVRVDFFGTPERLTEEGTERSNLPEDVQPGVTYRDVGIRLKIVSVFADIDRIVAEALGEVPAQEPAKEADAPPSAPPEDVPPGGNP